MRRLLQVFWSRCLLFTFEALIYTSGKQTRLLFVPQRRPSALSAVPRQSRALTNFGKPGRGRLHRASRAVKQPAWSGSVISPCLKRDVMLKREATAMATARRLDTLFSPYCRRLVESVQKMVLAGPPPPPIFVSSLCPVVQSIKASARLFVCACIGVSGCAAPFPLAGLS